MFEDYLKAILAAYEYKKVEGTLPPNLLHPTPGNLKEECLIVYRERYDSADDDVLRLFFSASDKDKGYTKSIQDCNVNDFRQVKKILNRNTPNPGLKFIELIAWLIDFKPRPSILYYKQADRNKTTNHLENSNVPPEETNEPNVPALQVTIHEVSEQKTGTPELSIHGIPGPGGQKTKPSIRTIVLACTGIFLVAGATFFLWKDKTPSTLNGFLPAQKCMYWKGDHYEPVDCNEKITASPVVPLNIRKLNTFKKITLPDTLTKNSLGKVWYIRTGNQREYFTDSGNHPVDTVRTLRPLSEYILFKYISYYRYLLTLLLWSICAVVFIGLCSISLIAFRKKRRRKMLALTSPKMLA
ncbi:hypothetical protein DBR43_26790 [Pedobacter sp. KBW06]|uniref:hypothetical protein n=1 Tax=Pedobacter sp. KBW06 TaxID=2153359 RepID=UPI000F596F21|nr:hypothetical protein [Pedobacter sp. KBW06]RQO65859.1 hypothetical protein DBR43_26790 [Pedobacter sp. KBW06]